MESFSAWFYTYHPRPPPHHHHHQAVPPHHVMSARKSVTEAVQWPLMSFVVLGSLAGVGLLSLPGAYQRLGWIPALICLYGIAGIASYSGMLYARMMSSLPWVTSWHELGHRALGPRGVVLVACTAYAAIFLVPIVLHLTAAETLQQLFADGHRPSLLLSGFAVTVVMLPLAQIKRLAQLGWLGTASSVVMASAMLALVVKLGVIDPIPPEGAHTKLVEHQPITSAVVGAMDILFAFSYARRGGTLDADEPITTQLVPDAVSTAINAGVLLAVLVNYVIHMNVVTQVFLELVAPHRFKPLPHKARTLGATGGEYDEATQPLLEGHEEEEEARLSLVIRPTVAEPASSSVEVVMVVGQEGMSRAGRGDPPAGIEEETAPLLPLATVIKPTPAAGGQAAGPPSSTPATLTSPAGTRAAGDPFATPAGRQVAAITQAPPAGAPTSSRRAGGGEAASEAITLVQIAPEVVQALRTVSEAEQALGTGVMLPCMVQELQAEDTLVGGGTRDPELGYTITPTPAPTSTATTTTPSTTTAPGTTRATTTATATPARTRPTPNTAPATTPATTSSTPATTTFTGTTVLAEPQPEAAGQVVQLPQGVGSSSGSSGGGRAAGVGGKEEPFQFSSGGRVEGGRGGGGGGGSGGMTTRSAVVPSSSGGPPGPGAADRERVEEGTNRMLWALTSSSIILLSWLVGHWYPSFSDLMAVISSVGCVSAMILLPCLFAALLLPMHRIELGLCGALCALSLSLSGLGVFASIKQLLSKDDT